MSIVSIKLVIKRIFFTIADRFFLKYKYIIQLYMYKITNKAKQSLFNHICNLQTNSLINRKFSSLRMTSQTGWTRLIRFVGEDGESYSGQPIVDSNGLLPPISELKANIIQGDVLTGEKIHIMDKTIKVKKLLTPLAPSKIPIIRCIGLNYKEHAMETSKPIPKFPILFIKPSTSLQNPFDKIRVPTIATNNQVDYETELAVVIGKDCKDVNRDDALQYVLGYTVANDISARKWQGYLGSGQWCFSKGFDTFCPIGPQLVSPSIIKDPNSLGIRTKLNDNQSLLQNSNTSDMIFDIPELISFLSQGTTLQAGSLILTGTPQGVGFTKKPPIYLQHNDKIEAEIDQIGTLTNVIEYENQVYNSKL